MSPTDARETFDRLVRGDQKAFDTLYRAYHPSLCAFASSIVQNAAAAEDVVQDVFVTLWTNRKTLATPVTPRAYLYSAVRNRALNHLRRQSLTDAWEAREEVESIGSFEHQSAADEVEAQETHNQLQTALNSLSPRSKIAATLRWYEQMSYAEIAEAMGISEKSVENQIARALKALRIQFNS